MKPRSAAPCRPGALLPILAAAAAPVVLSLTANAQITDWVGPAGTGDWNVAANWSTGAVPGNNATVRIRNSDAVDRTVNYNYAGPSVSYGTVLIAQIGGGTNTNTLSLAANRLNTTDMYVGHTGPGVVVQSGGTNSVSGSLFIGYNDGSGEYRLSGGWLFGSPLVGFYGNASFKHTGGTVTNGILNIQAIADRRASYELSGTGELRESQITLSGPGSATFTQTGGLTSTNQFTIGGSSGSATATVSGGTFSAFGQTIGSFSDGVFNHTGGASTGSTIFIGSSGGYGTYNLSGSATLSRTNSAVLVGSSGDGTFNQSGGSVDASLVRIGSTATGTYNHTAGSAKLTTLDVGYGASGAGEYNLSGSATLTVADTTTVGVSGGGTFNHSGGTHTAKFMIVASSSNRASYTLGGTGYLRVTETETLGRAGGTATFTQEGGYHEPRDLLVGDGSRGFTWGGYVMSGGQLVLDGILSLGTKGALGTFDHTGGTVTGSRINIASGVSTKDGSAALGTYTLGGTGALTAAFDENVGVAGGFGEFKQTGGTNVIKGTTGLRLGWDVADSAGTYDLSGGSLSTLMSIAGGAGQGTFTQSGGTHTANDLMIFARGAYKLSGGSLTAGTLTNYAQFTQTGGTADLGPITSTGTLTVKGGRLTAAYVRQSSLAVDGTGTVEITPNGGAGGASKVGSLLVGTSATLDLADNAIVIDHTGTSPLADVRDRIIAGRNGGNWDAAGITSSAARGNPSATALGYAEAADLFGASGGTFMGQSADGTAVLVRYTRLGDANLDGTVNFSDLLSLARNYNGTPATLGAGWWSRGDFTYDGVVNFSDLLVLAKNYNASVPTGPVPGAAAGFDADLGRALAAVPEPSALAGLLIGTCGAALTSRRTRARRT